MNDALLDLAPVSPDDIITITQAVWSSFLELELTAVPCESAVLTGPVLVAVVSISGAWEGAVQLECSPDHARAAAAAMFAGDAGTASDDEARDALGELANIVSGNLKSLLPPPSALSIPWVRPAASSTGSAEDAEPATQEPLRRVAFVAAPGVLHVSIWKGRTS